MSTYICKCGWRVKKSTNADNTGNRLEGYGPGHECYGCPYVLSWGTYEWNEEAKNLEQKTKGYECRMSKTLSYASQFIGSTKDKCTCSVVSLDFGFLEQISAWVKETFTLGELTGHFSRDKIRATEYCHNGRYQYALYCAQNKKGIAAKAALFEHFFNPDGSRKDMTPQQEMEKILTDIKKAKEILSCAPVQNADAAAITAERAAPNAATETLTTSESEEDASALTPVTSLQNCESVPAVSADGSSESPQDKPLTFIREDKCPAFDYSQFDEQTAQTLQNYAFRALQVARTYYRDLMEIVVGAHQLLCGPLVHDVDNSRFGNRGEDTFRAWCTSVHISKSKAYQLLQIQSFMDTCTPEEQSTLALLPFTAMRELVTGDTPEQIITMAKEGKVGTSKEVLELKAQLKAEQERAAAAEAREEEAWKMQSKAEARAKTAEAERDKARADRLSTAKDCNRLGLKVSQEKDRADKAEARAKTAEDALKKQPITGVVDKDEVQRQAEALSRKDVQEARQQAAEAQARLRQYQEDAEGLLAPAQACAEQAQFIADSVRAMYLKWFGNAVAAGTSLARMGTPLYAVCGEIMSSLEEENTINPTAAGSEEDAEREALFE